MPTTTTTPARVRLWQPTQRPKHRAGEWIETAWGKCQVTGRLGQRHADLLECLLRYRDSSRQAGNRTELLIDPARIRRALSDGGHSQQRIQAWLKELVEAVIHIKTPGMEIIGHLIDTVRVSRKTKPDPLGGGERNLWVVTLGDGLTELLRLDLPLYYDPSPIARLEHGISQAVARHILTHQHQPRGGWALDGLIRAVAGDVAEQSLWDARRRIRSDAEGLANAGLIIRADRVTLAHRPDALAQRPDSLAQRPDAWRTGPA